MKFETLARRIAEKSGFPGLEQALIRGEAHSLPTDQCMVWTGTKTTEGLSKKLRRDAEMRPYYTINFQFSFPKIRVNKKEVYVHRLVFDKTIGLPENGRLSNRCGETLCVNPLHWSCYVPHRAPPPTEADIPPCPEIMNEWPIEDVIFMVEQYLDHGFSNIDPEHSLLMDIPLPLLKEALSDMNKEHML